MTKQEAQDALYLIRKQLDKFPIISINGKQPTVLRDAYTIVDEMLNSLEEDDQ